MATFKKFKKKINLRSDKLHGVFVLHAQFH